MKEWKAIKQKQPALIASEIMGWSLGVADGWDLLVAVLIFFFHSMNQTLKEDSNHLWIQSDYN